MPDTGLTSHVIEAICAWFDANGRDLPWRRPGTSAWGVLVSEVMSQQTPMSRVIGPWHEWMNRWPTPDDLAEEDSGEAVAAWGRLGYPRRALRLHSCAVTIATEHDGVVPNSYDELVALPGIGDYTASAVVSFAFGGRATVLDTNVRRLIARAESGIANCPTSVTRAERIVADALVPDEDARAAKWAVASMELGALVCTARSPQCEVCPIRDGCRWVIDGRPDNAPARRGQPWKGTDRQCRGVIMDVVRNSPHGVKVQMALSAWPELDQASRCLESLLDDGLVHRRGNLISL
ncbi:MULTISPECIES: A/G-specific adenine glycosylase [Cutibacterium]|uniref:Adenine DNA glycosylase n=2 Tax=Cutibacterium acnes TaxID=1747 RepID=A0AA44U681_CUTAC|nr:MULTISPECIES: A/G-specific adenine glycosylase [Cutibacterium]EGL42692.1 putative A/G-specific adenine glycosylase [Propionibacterium sp. 434-HC2]ERS20788.1 A/G-specific adenine glycosylase [Propionibacterium sp. KPL2008]ERS33856.1 A/G-specific adenine glycosylase [Propionibacterium sp. KPL1847]ERS67759.1 A/G-specific adenine glycosylase [Propionibacterium sp. KPL1849]MCM4178517.1 A/G-specific adenine glycosylase [Cutibacterium acnes P03]MCM4183257.1 A/G-specific adenine glycosylase [Cutib